MASTMVPPLLPALARLPDPRQRRGRRHPLPAVLTLASAAMLCDCENLLAIATWARGQGAEAAARLGFSPRHTPSVSTLHRIFRCLDMSAFEEAVAEWVAHVIAICAPLKGATPPLRSEMRDDGSDGKTIPALIPLRSLREELRTMLTEVPAFSASGQVISPSELLVGLVLEGWVVSPGTRAHQRDRGGFEDGETKESVQGEPALSDFAFDPFVSVDDIPGIIPPGHGSGGVP